MTAVKRCPRCGRVRPAGEFYRRRSGRLSSFCRSCQRAAGRLARQRRRQDQAAADQLRAVDRIRQRRRRGQAAWARAVVMPHEPAHSDEEFSSREGAAWPRRRCCR
jgi:hypothetical protein